MLPGPGSSVNLGHGDLDRLDLDRLGLDGLDSPGFGASGLDPLERDALRSGESAPQQAGSLPAQGSPRTGDPFAVLASPPSDLSLRGANPDPAGALIGIDDVQKALNRSRASVYRYTNTDPRNLNPPFNPRKLNPEYRTDQKDPLLFHPNEVARFARDVLRIKEVTVEVLNAPSTATQQLLTAILDELRGIRQRLDRLDGQPGFRGDSSSRFDQQSRPAA